MVLGKLNFSLVLLVIELVISVNGDLAMVGIVRLVSVGGPALLET